MAIPATDFTKAVRSYRAFSPVDQVAGNITGVSVTRSGGDGAPRALSGKLVITTGAITGSPSAQTVDCIVQHSIDGGSTWATLTDRDGSNVAITQITAANGHEVIDFQCDNAGALIRAYATVAFTAGSTPSIVVGGVLVVGGFDELPHGG